MVDLSGICVDKIVAHVIEQTLCTKECLEHWNEEHDNIW
jgi:hypothetical protein